MYYRLIEILVHQTHIDHSISNTSLKCPHICRNIPIVFWANRNMEIFFQSRNWICCDVYHSLAMWYNRLISSFFLESDKNQTKIKH